MSALAAIAILGVVGFTYSVFKGGDSHSHGYSVTRRSLHAQKAAAKAGGEEGLTLRGSGQILKKGVMGHAPADTTYSAQSGLLGSSHNFAILTGQGKAGRPVWGTQQLQTALEDFISPVSIKWYSPSESEALSYIFGVGSLPAVVYQLPHCLPSTCGAAPVLELRVAKGEFVSNVTMDLSSPPATSVQAVSRWVREHVVRPAMMLANDHPTKTFLFRHVIDPEHPDQGAPLGSFVKEPAERGWIETPNGAQWVVTDNDAPKDVPAPVLKRLKVKGDSLLVMRGDECDVLNDAKCVLPLPPAPELTKEVQANRQVNWDRLATDIIAQKKTTPTYTKNGYEKTKAPPLLYAMLRDFFMQHNGSAVNEIWSSDNIYVNHHDSRFQLVDIPETGTARATLYDLIRPVFEKWAGVAPLQDSAIYGIRIYTAGAILQNHVDRSDTHIISAIVNVAQDVTKPWPLEIVGHDMIRTQVTMEPGDMILYEGASCSHGRPSPLQGRFMGNVFFHMAPTKDAKRITSNSN